MATYSELSEHDKKLIDRIEAIDRCCGSIEWTTISSLASQLENKDRREFWESRCKTYNHLEEARIGEL